MQKPFNSLIFVYLGFLFLSACSVDTKIKIEDSNPLPNGSVQEPSAKYTGPREVSHGQYIVTSSGYKLNAQFYQISEKKVLANGYKLDGVFNE